MAGKTITMSNLKQIIRHRDNGMALQTISKTLGPLLGDILDLGIE